MSHNDNNIERAARNHRPAILAIAVALGLALLAFLVFGGWGQRGETEPADPVPAEVTSGTVPAGTVSPPGTPGAETAPATGTATPATN